MARLRTFAAVATAVGALGAAVFGCGNAFDSQSNVVSLRAFAVHVSADRSNDATNTDTSISSARLHDQAYASPGSDVSLKLLYWDQSPRALLPNGKKRDVQVLWLPGCENPVGDLYYECFAQFPSILAKLSSGAGLPQGTMPPAANTKLATFFPSIADQAHNIEFQFPAPIPSDIITSRPTPASPTLPYGLEYVFFLVCGGDLVYSPTSGSSQSFPIGCNDATTGEALGPDDFVVGYTPVYAYDMQPSGFGVSTVNTNPPVTQMMYQGAISKFGTPAGACPANPCAADEKCGSSGYCIPVIPHCTGKNISDCPAYTLSPVIPSDMISEKDTTAPPVNGDSPGQSVWVDYYTSQGRMGNETALVNDSVTGYQSDFSSGWTAPSSAAGEARIWAVVHTNRGGTAWVFQDVFID